MGSVILPSLSSNFINLNNNDGDGGLEFYFGVIGTSYSFFRRSVEDEQPWTVVGNFSEGEAGFGEVIVHEGHIDKLREVMQETTLETCLPTRKDHVLEDLNTEPLRNAEGDLLFTTEVVGKTFTERKGEIWSWLMDDNVSSIGIYRMGGVSKTALVTHINNQLLETPNPFHHVYWITVGQDFSIFRLQNLIAMLIFLSLSDEDGEKKRTSKLYHEKKNFVLILDDLWNHFTSKEVGIPVGRDECKLIITTRLLQVCRLFSYQKKRMGSEKWDSCLELLATSLIARAKKEVAKVGQEIQRRKYRSY